MRMMNNRIVVIGGGAAGMMAAISAAEQGAQVTLLEPNERLGKKLNITGKGRCNVTNNTDIEGLLANIPRNGKFLYGAFTNFSSADTMAFFEALGVPLKTERGNRVFPVSDSAFDVSAALERRLKALRVRIARDRAVSLEIADGAARGVAGERGSYPADGAILATGGVSYPGTGSTGDGHRLAAAAGHTVTPLRGSLVPLQGVIAPGIPCVRLQGLSLRNIGLTVFENNKKLYTDFGELLFTHFGVSGPLILSASAHMRYFDKKQYRLEIDLKPALDEQQLDKRLLSDFGKYANHDFQNALDDLLPQKLIPVVVQLSEIPGRQKVHDLTREQRQSLLLTLIFRAQQGGGRTCQSGGYGQCGGGNSSQRTGQKFLHDDSSKRQKSFVILIILAWFSGFVTCFDEKNRCIPGKKEPFCPLFKSVGNSV